MKIVLLSMNFAPELTGVGKYSGEMADGLIARGHEVCVVCAPPYYPSWSVHDGHHADRYVTERPRPGLTVIRCPIWIPKRLGGLARLLHLASFALSSLPAMLRLVAWQPDLVFAVAPGLFCAPSAWLSARLAGARAWLHIQDLEVDAAFEMGLLKGRVMRRAVLAVERLLFSRFDVVSTISQRMVRQLVSKGVMLERTELLQNWVDVRALRPTAGSPALRDRMGIAPDATVCLFSGTINRKQGVGLLVEVARRLQHRHDIVIVICGDGEMRPEIEASAKSLPNVRLLGLQPAAELNALLNMADIHLLPQLKGVADLVLPSKLGGMLASGRPVVASVAPASAIACVVSGRGLVVAPECAESFMEAVVSLTDDPQLRSIYGQAARRYAERVLDANAVFDTLERRVELACAPDAPPVQLGEQRGA